jgi:hypothetical protein
LVSATETIYSQLNLNKEKRLFLMVTDGSVTVVLGKLYHITGRLKNTVAISK